MASVFSKKVAIVTGASSGIGKYIALMFASRGANVTISGRDKERLTSTFDEAVKLSGGYKDMFLTVQGDLNDRKNRKEIVDQTVEKFGGLDILVANAGVTQAKQSVITASEETYDFIMDTNLKSTFFLIQEAIPHLEKSKGNIINISSIGTSFVLPRTTVYSLSKICLDHLTKYLAVELGSKGIRVNVINPGFILTRIFRHHGINIDRISTNTRKVELSTQALKDKVLTFQDITETVSFLASDAAGFITGESIIIDGGRRFVGLMGYSAQRGQVEKKNN